MDLPADQEVHPLSVFQVNCLLIMLQTIPYTNCTKLKGILFPEGTKFRQLIVTGPPCSGKSTIIKKLGGWFEEGFLDLTFDGWWKNKIFFTRPREVHLGLPFHGFNRPLAVFQPEWVENPQDISFERILLPPKKKFFWEVDWRRRFVFEFLIPSAEVIQQRRQIRASKHTHYVDFGLMSLEMIRKQIVVYQKMALYWKKNGFLTHVREDLNGPPLYILDKSPKTSQTVL